MPGIEIYKVDTPGGRCITKAPNLDLKIFADASYGDKGETSRSQTGVLTTLGGQPIGWYSRRQDVVALSITEAEYITDCEGAKDSSWTSQFLAELKMSLEQIPQLWTDSEGPQPDNQVLQTEPPHRAPLSLYPTGSGEKQACGQNSCWEGQPVGHPHQDHPHEHGEYGEETMHETNWSGWFDFLNYDAMQPIQGSPVESHSSWTLDPALLDRESSWIEGWRLE